MKTNSPSMSSVERYNARPLARPIVVALTLGRRGSRESWGRATSFRGGWWYLIRPAILAGGLLAAFVVNVMLGPSGRRARHNGAGRLFIPLK